MKPCIFKNDSHLTYLAPPCLHDPSSVSGVASLPPATRQNFPESVQVALYNLQQSTSIVYASYVRLQELLQERFDRLIPSIDPDGELEFSESSFFNYVNSLSAERAYLLSDAQPDWRHKASTARIAIQPYEDQVVDSGSSFPDVPYSVLEWWECLDSAVGSWCEYAKVVHVPDFEDTIAEYMSIQKQTPALALDLDDSPLETPFATLTPVSDKSSDLLRDSEIQIRDSISSLLPEGVMTIETSVTDSMAAIGLGKLAHTQTQEFHLNDEGQVRSERIDSGVGMTD